MTKRNLIDTALDAGATFDWITPGLALLSGNSVLAVPRDDQAATQAALSAAGIRVHHEQLFDGQYVFGVAPGDLDAALALLGAERKRGGGAAWVWALVAGAAVAAIVIGMGGVR